MDQQCTVTRPGLSYIASALSVELLVGLLQYSSGRGTENNKNVNVPSNSDCRLGRIPHQIRGNLSNQEMFTLTGTAFEHCTCCSDQILTKFEQEGFELVKIACNSPEQLEKISGLTELKQVSDDINSFSLSYESDDQNE